MKLKRKKLTKLVKRKKAGRSAKKVATRKPAVWNLKSRIRSALRRVWLWSPMRKQAMDDARLSRGLYECQGCKVPTSRQGVQVDHDLQVTGVEGILDWNEFIDRLFCPSDALSILCTTCHRKKTNEENEARKAYRRNKA